MLIHPNFSVSEKALKVFATLCGAGIIRTFKGALVTDPTNVGSWTLIAADGALQDAGLHYARGDVWTPGVIRTEAEESDRRTASLARSVEFFRGLSPEDRAEVVARGLRPTLAARLRAEGII